MERCGYIWYTKGNKINLLSIFSNQGIMNVRIHISTPYYVKWFIKYWILRSIFMIVWLVTVPIYWFLFKFVGTRNKFNHFLFPIEVSNYCFSLLDYPSLSVILQMYALGTEGLTLDCYLWLWHRKTTENDIFNLKTGDE